MAHGSVHNQTVVARDDAALGIPKRARRASGFPLLAPATAVRAFVAITLCGSILALLVRLVAGAIRKPFFMDEAVTGMISARPLRELLETTVWERGGAPAHFVATHVFFLFDSSPIALRLVSVTFALLTVAVSFDLGRRLGGPTAGAIAAAVAATSALLVIYGTYGRMYSMFAFAGGLACDLFIRAMRKRTVGAAVAGALAASFLAAVHPFGGLLVAIEACVAIWLWRGRPLRAGLPVMAIALGTVSVLGLADLRLGNRFSTAIAPHSSLLTPKAAAIEIVQALLGYSGGITIAALILVPLGLLGAYVVIRKEPLISAVTIFPFLAVLLIEMAISTSGGINPSTRHLIFMLPAWSAFVGVATTRLAAGYRASVALGFFAAVIAAAAFGGAVNGMGKALDPRADPLWSKAGTSRALRAPAHWVQTRVRADDVLFPYSPPYLEALPQTAKAFSLPRDPPTTILAALGHIRYPVANVFVALPVPQAKVDLDALTRSLGPRYTVVRFQSWLLLEAHGPFRSGERVLAAVLSSARAAGGAISGATAEGRFYLRVVTSNVCYAHHSLAAKADHCPALVS